MFGQRVYNDGPVKAAQLLSNRNQTGHSGFLQCSVGCTCLSLDMILHIYIGLEIYYCFIKEYQPSFSLKVTIS